MPGLLSAEMELPLKPAEEAHFKEVIESEFQVSDRSLRDLLLNDAKFETLKRQVTEEAVIRMGPRSAF
jgi:hypothetical protein